MNTREEEFLWLCKTNNVEEFYVNFDNPFTEEHNSNGDVCLVYRNGKFDFAPFYAAVFLPVFSPILQDENCKSESGIWCYEIFDGDQSKLLTRNATIRDSSFKCIYIKGKGIIKQED